MGAPGHDVLARVAFPAIGTFDSSRSPKRGERVATPRTLAAVDLSAIIATLTAATPDAGQAGTNAGRGRAEMTRMREQLAERERELDASYQRIAELETQAAALRERLGRIAALSVAAEEGEPPTMMAPSLPAPASAEEAAPEPVTAPRQRRAAHYQERD